MRRSDVESRDVVLVHRANAETRLARTMRVMAWLVLLSGGSSGCPAPEGGDSGDADVDTDVDADSDADTDVTCFPDDTRSLDEVCASRCASASECGPTDDCWLVNGCPGGSQGICGTRAEACLAEGCAGPCCFGIGADPVKVTSCEHVTECCG